MAEVVCSLRRAFMALPAHDELGPSTITFGQIEGGYRPYVVPDRAKVWVDMRLTPPTDTAAATRMVELAIAGAEAAVPGCHGSYTVTGDRPAIERDPNSPLLAALKRAADDVTDADTTVGFFTGYTDTAVIAGKTDNRNCMSYGPRSLALAHKPNEYVPHADIVRCQQVLIALADNVLWDASWPSWGIISREQTDSCVRTAHESTSVSLHPPDSGPRARGAACNGQHPERQRCSARSHCRWSDAQGPRCGVLRVRMLGRAGTCDGCRGDLPGWCAGGRRRGCRRYDRRCARDRRAQGAAPSL